MLSERKRSVLKAIITEYVNTAEPVGSRALARRHNLGVSTATIRNEMADLEEMGFLMQPHVSAGRIPSDYGYRFYVDHLMEHDQLTYSEQDLLNQLVYIKSLEADMVLATASRLLSQLSNYVGLITSPRIHTGRLTAIELIHLSRRLALALFFTDNGQVENRVLVLPPEVESRHIESLAAYFTHRLAGRPMEEITGQLLDELYSELLEDHIQNHDFISRIAQALMNWLKSGGRSRVFTGGAHNILGQPEFQDVEKVRHLFALFEEEALLLQLLQREPGITITIGQENRLPVMQDCTVVSSTYTVNGKSTGTVAVLGPTRMDYAHVISVLEHLTGCLEKAFSSHDDEDRQQDAVF
ncbi:MAG: heat-inducible transcription repressor HrcA [Firmicutes bacterium]|nr:heat-inducible transcription repressor HrcA [Bacillota bacterium]